MSATELSAELDQYMAQLLPGARVEAQSLRQCPEIQLMLINADFPRRQLEPTVTLRLMEEPPYWAFCWASGQVLARYLLDNPHWVVGRHVLDFGAGSGVVGIAAMLAGASRVTCCDIDPLACLAIEANALLNGVHVSIETQLPAARADLITLADVLYDRDNLPLVESLVSAAPNLLLADSRVRNLRLEPFYSIGEYESSTWPDLDESREFNRVRIYCAGTMPR